MGTRGKRAGQSFKAPVITMAQARLARATAEFGGVPGMTKAKIRKIAGVKSDTVEKTQGFKAALASYGLTEKLIATALADDIKNKPRNRYHELSLAADILGMKKQANAPTSARNLTLIISGETASRYGALQPKHVDAKVIEPDASQSLPE